MRISTMIECYEKAYEDLGKVCQQCKTNPCKESYVNYKTSLEHFLALHKTLSANIEKEIQMHLARARTHCEYF